MLTFVEQYGWNKFSQNNEDGLIQECIKRIKPDLLRACEFGGANGFYCSNTALLREQGWQVDMYDLNACPPYVMACMITPENVNKVVRPCSVLSIDIDGLDYGVWAAYEGRPDIVIIEVNSSVGATSSGPVNDPVHGTGYSRMMWLGINKGYFLLCHTGNCIFILNEHRRLFPEIIDNGLNNYKDYFNKSWL